MFGKESKKMMMRIAFLSDNERVGKGRIVFVGDSLTAYCDLPTFYPELNTVNRGIAGDFLHDLPERMDYSVYDLEPSAIVFEMGLNDLNFLSATIDDMEKTYDGIFSDWAERYPTIPIIVQSLYPIRREKMDVPDPFPVKNHVYGMTTILNEKLKVLCQKYDFRFLDVFSLLSDGKELKKEYSLDGAHVNNNAYALISGCIRQALQEEFARKINRSAK